MPNAKHISPERLEDYYRFGSSALDLSIDEHLRRSQECRDRLAEIGRFHVLRQSGAIQGSDRHYEA